MESAERLAEEAKFKPGPSPPDGRKYSLPDRQKISEYLLILYCSTQPGDRVEYVWLDEFCLSDACLSSEHDTSDIESQRRKELGRLPDIFRYAAQVVVFCAHVGCDHTTLSCPWGNRIWTIPEILHAQTVLQITREEIGGRKIPRIFRMSGHVFREAIQNQAAIGNQWHLYAIYQNSVNSGAVPWQQAIHALVVEAIRRDEAGNYVDHNLLGKVLNGLLPRRAHLEDLGRGGWNDLVWMLELNQAFYNAASLAAICAIPEDSSVSWLGRPLQPMAGNERLQPIVTALPVAPPSENASRGCPPLMIIGGEMICLPSHLRRDWAGLYNNPVVRPIRIAAGGILVTGGILFVILLSTFNFRAGLAILLSASVGHAVIELLVSTMFLERKGWIFLRDSTWGGEIEETKKKLGDLDSNLRTLKPWGESQLVPEWQRPTKRLGECIPGKFVDLKSGIYLETTVVELPDMFVPLAIHGNGVTCVSLRRGSRSHEMTFGAQKVGIANFPPYIMAHTTKMGDGVNREPMGRQEQNRVNQKPYSTARYEGRFADG
ncbi:hypothetical protein C8J57DRAFT_1199564 [Mycena rebaudengoi]|nr:hypothetical protein C8J57DRAFT_1199564 [Mycena rebaudengoi]